MKAGWAELVGTFTLTFIGAGAGALAASNGAGLLGVAWAHGLALMVIIYAWGSISGAHVNPAVTLGVALAGKMKWDRAVLYWIAQFAGAAIAAYLLYYLVGTLDIANFKNAATTGKFTPLAGSPGDVMRCLTVEAVLTFFLVSAVFASGVYGLNGNLAGVAIGLVLTMDIIMGGALTGASMNPARSFGPALVLGELGYLWIYIVGPFIGGAVAALLYEKVFQPAEAVSGSDAQKGKRR
jgi:MIP family channel proteins